MATRIAAALAAPPIQVHLVAPAIVCWGLQRLVQTTGPQLRLLGASSTLSEAMPILESMPPDVLVIDLDDGYRLADVARIYDGLRLKVLVLTSTTDRAFMEAMMQAGARGILQKRDPPAALLKAIETVGRGGSLPPRPALLHSVHSATAPRASSDAHGSRIGLLTLRERQTIAAITSDVTVPGKVIAGRLRITEHTLRNHLTSIYSKLGVSGRLALYAFAREHGLGRAGPSRDHSKHVDHIGEIDIDLDELDDLDESSI